MQFGELMTICSLDIEWKPILEQMKGHTSGTNVPKMSCDNPKVDIVNMDEYIKFGEILSISSQDIERKRNFGIIQGS